MIEEYSQEDISVIWRRIDMPGHEAARIYDGEDGWYIDGAAVFLYEGKPVRLEYLIECDPNWRTSFVTVDGFVGDEVVAVEIEVDDDGVWYLNGEEISDVEGCVDIDLNFSPVTNLLPIKRTEMDAGDSSTVRAAWLRFPSFDLEPLEQSYARKSESVYSYQSSTGFEKDITVDDFGLVKEYPDFWITESR